MTTRRHFSNAQLATMLEEMAALYEMKGVEFKPRAYERAAHGVESFAGDVQDAYATGGMKALDAIPGVGSGIAEHLVSLFTTGHFREYETLKKAVPVDIAGLTQVQGIGPQTVKTLWKKLRVRSVADLERAARAGKISTLPHFGKRTEAQILKNIEFLRKSGGRFVLGFVEPEVERLQQLIARIAQVDRAVVAGSYRRRKETIGDVDILVASRAPERVMERIIGLPLVAHVYGTGPTKTSLRLKSGINVDVRIVPARSWGAALAYFTGSKAHNVALRAIALRHGWKLSEYGLFKDERLLAGANEQDVYAKLGIAFVEPELREMTGELDAAKADRLPRLIDYGDLRGDLQVQTKATDGHATIAAMADAAEAAGLEYIAITDHTKSLAMTGGLDEAGLRAQMREIARVNARRAADGKKLAILSGAEVNIGKDGSLDIADEVLAELDVVGASIHSFFDLPRATQTKRLIRAMENPHVDIIFHPTCRLINERPEIRLDLDAVIAAAKRTGTVLEIDAFPDRLDLRDEYVRRCVDAGVLLAIDSDAHAPEHFSVLKYGVAQARRGWASADDVINTLPLRRMLAQLKGRRRSRALRRLS